MSNIHALLMAAGASQRMGSPKQLLPWGNSTLIEHQITRLQQANIGVSVVLGAHFELVRTAISHLNVSVFFNEHWQEGMGKSIAHGAQELVSKKAGFHGILIALVDQPLISTNHYLKMASYFDPRTRQIIVSQSDTGITGPPVLFDASYLEELMTLQGDDGAKPVIKNHSQHTMFMQSDDDLDDMDTVEGYRRMLKRSNRQS